MTIEELKKVRKVISYAEWCGMLDAEEGASSIRRREEYMRKLKALLVEFEDAACTHDWKPLFPRRLFRCCLCETVRIREAS